MLLKGWYPFIFQETFESLELMRLSDLSEQDARATRKAKYIGLESITLLLKLFWTELAAVETTR